MEMEFYLYDCNDLENQGHIPKINRHPKSPMEKLYTKFQIDSCKTLRYYVEMGVFGWIDKQTDRTITKYAQWTYKKSPCKSHCVGHNCNLPCQLYGLLTMIAHGHRTRILPVEH